MKKIVFSEQARADVRRLDRETALRIFAALQRLAAIGQGDVRRLRDEGGELRFARRGVSGSFH